MDMKNYLRGLPKSGQKEFATRCGYSLGHIRNVAYGIKPCTSSLAIAAERHSGGIVTRKEVFSDWADHWPELAKTSRPAFITSKA